MHSRFSKGFVLEGVKITLENNNCNFNDEFYREIRVTAKTTIFVSTYATLPMGYFEIHICDIFEFKWGKVFQEFMSEDFSRFLDACQTALDKDKVKPQKLSKTLNYVNEAIQFTM